jgi:hypothetical protein
MRGWQGSHPLVQAFPAVAEPVARSGIGAGDESVVGHGHVENGCGHGVSCSRLWTRLGSSRPQTGGWFGTWTSARHARVLQVACRRSEGVSLGYSRGGMRAMVYCRGRRLRSSARCIRRELASKRMIARPSNVPRGPAVALGDVMTINERRPLPDWPDACRAARVELMPPEIRGRPLSPLFHLAAESVLVLTGGCDGSRAR